MNRRNTLRILTFWFLGMAVIMALIYMAGRQRRPLVYKYIPDENKVWISHLNDDYKYAITDVEKGPYKWDNDKDLGVKEEWSKAEDPNFIVYYHEDDRNVWSTRAELVLKWANEAILDLENLMGKYYFPEDVNGRKLAIYLPEKAANYASLINRLMEQQCNSIGSIGICIVQIGPLGCQTKGIVLHPDCFDPSTGEKNSARKTLRHEMDHYVYFSSLNYSKELGHPLWTIEGMAEYFCDRSGHQINSMDSISFINENCDLSKNFPAQWNSSYWAGESFYRFVADENGSVGVSEFIKGLYEHKVDTAIMIAFPEIQDVHELWVNNLLRNGALLQNLEESQVIR